MSIKALLLTSTLIISSCSFAQEYEVYKVQKGDTISDLLKDRGVKTLYGKESNVSKNLNINRLNESTAKKLEVGSYVMVPLNAKKAKIAVLLKDSISTGQAGTSRVGLLAANVSTHQKIEFNMRFSQKTTDLKAGGLVRANKNYQAGVKVIGTAKGKPTLGFTITNSSSLEFENDKNLIVDLKPSFEAFTEANVLSSNGIYIGPHVAVSEESSIDYKENAHIIRRDQNVWAGIKASTRFSFTKFQLDLSAKVKRNFLTQNMADLNQLHLTRSTIALKANLSRDYFLSAFSQIESGDRASSSLGLNFIYSL